MKRRILRALGLVAALAAIAVLADICLMSTAWGVVHSVYYIPNSGDWTDALLLMLFALWAGVSQILAPPRRPRRRLFSRVRAPRLDGRVVSSRPAVSVSTVERGPGAVYLSSSWRSS